MQLGSAATHKESTVPCDDDEGPELTLAIVVATRRKGDLRRRP